MLVSEQVHVSDHSGLKEELQQQGIGNYNVPVAHYNLFRLIIFDSRLSVVTKAG